MAEHPWGAPSTGLAGICVHCLSPEVRRIIPWCPHTLALWTREVSEAIWVPRGPQQLDPWRRFSGIAPPYIGQVEPCPNFFSLLPILEYLLITTNLGQAAHRTKFTFIF